MTQYDASRFADVQIALLHVVNCHVKSMSSVIR